MMPVSMKMSPNAATDAGPEQVVDHVHVRRHARHQPAYGVLVVERQIELLQMRVDLPSACRNMIRWPIICIR
jgi:hypothetical protein